MKRFLLCGLILLSCRTEKLRPVPPCEPSPEVCDGSDNDCNGYVDDLMWSCASACGTGIATCTLACTARLPSPEECNSRDDDCDGLIDETADLSITACYPRDPAELRAGECRFGLTRCIGGHTQCMGAITPVYEACDGKDNDCDGQIDEGTGDAADLIFIIDNSCSMANVIANVRAAVSDFADNYATRTDLRWGIVTAPAPWTATGDSPRLWLDLTTPEKFTAGLAQQDGYTGSGMEPTLDALAYINDSANPLNITWAPNARRVAVVVSDEGPQSYITPTITTLTVTIGVFVFTDPAFAPEWARYGRTFNIYKPDLRTDLNEIIKEVACK